MDHKLNFIVDWETGCYTMTELSEMHHISRKTAYKLINRYQTYGIDGLGELSRAPHTIHRVKPGLIELCIEVKRQYPKWGPKKVRAYLINHHPSLESVLPAASTIGDYFKQAGLVNTKKIRRRTPPYTKPFSSCVKPNDVWSIDYKGDFKVGKGQRCYPLTVTDNATRFILEIKAHLGTKHETAYNTMKDIFLVYGLPNVIRSDNGVPFASAGLGGLSKLSVWFLKLGIEPERIMPGHPEENGRHERMHLTLKNETASPPAQTFRQQQKRFDQFREYFNEVRPHEGIDNQCPGQLYHPSLRPYPNKQGDFEYEGKDIVRRVRTNGQIRWQGDFVYIGVALCGERIGLLEIEGGDYLIYVGHYLAGILERCAKKACAVPEKTRILYDK